MHLNSPSSCLNLLGCVCSRAAVGSLVASSWCLTNTLAPPCLLQGCLERFWQEQKGGRSTSGLSRIEMIPPVSTDTYTILKYTFLGSGEMKAPFHQGIFQHLCSMLSDPTGQGRAASVFLCSSQLSCLQHSSLGRWGKSDLEASSPLGEARTTGISGA